MNLPNLLPVMTPELFMRAQRLGLEELSRAVFGWSDTPESIRERYAAHLEKFGESPRSFVGRYVDDAKRRHVLAAHSVGEAVEDLLVFLRLDSGGET